MTRRERLENKQQRRLEWADKADDRSEAAFARADSIAKNIPFGQPILVGHHSERHARADQKRIHGAMDKGCAEASLARHHRARADGLEHQLATSIFSDDADALDQLAEKIAAGERRRERMKEINAAFRKAPGADKAAKLAALVAAGTITEDEGLGIARTFAIAHWEKAPFPSYALTNLGANIRRMEERVEEIKRRQQRAAEADAAGGVVVVDLGATEGGAAYVRVTFADKPDRSILDELRAAGFRWGGGSWVGLREKLPASVQAETETAAPL
jgi:hypothetical protein